jgi:hypothetical protein
MFRDGIEENTDLEVHGDQSATVDRWMFHLHVRVVLMLKIQLYR